MTEKKAAQKISLFFDIIPSKIRDIITALILSCLCCQNVLADNGRILSADNLVAEMIVDVESILAQDISDEVARTIKVSALFDRYFDLPTIAKFSAGPYWRTADATQRATYRTAIRGVIIGTVVRNFDQLSEFKFTPTSSSAKGKKLVLVNGVFTPVNKEQPVIRVGWRVLTHDTELPRILDVEIENISMLVTQKQENVAIVRKNKGKFSVLIDVMKQRSESND